MITRTRRLLAIGAAGSVVALGFLAAQPARAGGFTDTSLQASAGFTTSSLSLSSPTALSSATTSVQIDVAGHAGGGLSFSGVTPSVSGPVPGGVTVSALSGPLNDDFTVSGLAAGQDFTLTVSASPHPTHGITDRATVRILKDTSGDVALIFDQATVNVPPDTVYPNVQFTGKSDFTCASDEAIFPSAGATCDFSVTAGDFNLPGGGSATGTDTAPLTLWAQADLPAGLTLDNGNPGVLRPGTAVPDTYIWSTVLGAETDGAQGSLSFTLMVQGQPTPPPPGASGDYVNPFGNGIDVFQQHYAVNALITGWTATQHDPATHFVRTVNVHGGFSIEAVRPTGIASGLCVSNPVGSEPAGFAVGQLTLRGCNGSQFQGFNQPGGDGTALVSDVPGAGHVEPNGTGAPLIVKTAFDPWGGFKYTWTDLAHLPA